MPTGRKLGRTIKKYRCRVLSSSTKLSNLKAVGFSKDSDSVNGKQSGLSSPLQKTLNQFAASVGFSLLPGRLNKAWPQLVHLIGLSLSSGKEFLVRPWKFGIWCWKIGVFCATGFGRKEEFAVKKSRFGARLNSGKIEDGSAVFTFYEKPVAETLRLPWWLQCV